MSYTTGISTELATDLTTWAGLCRLGRECFFTSRNGGFFAHPGSPAAYWQARSEQSDWPGGPWPANGPTEPLHQVGLMLSQSAAGRLGEMSALLAELEVAWSLATHTRGVLEVCANLFRIYARSAATDVGQAAPLPAAGLRLYANAHLLIIDSAFSARTMAEQFLALDPTDVERRSDLQHATAELERVTTAYGQHYDADTTNVSSKQRLRLGGFALDTMTNTIDDLAAWMWPDPEVRPRPLYRVLSGHAHTSLVADLQMYDVVDSPAGRRLTRVVDRDFITLNVGAATVVFQRIFAALVGFYGWNETPLHEYSERLAATFPSFFKYGP